MEENEERTLYENLEYLNETKGIIKQAIIDKGVEISADTPFREYADKISDITTGEDLEAELSAQEQVIQEMKIALENKAAGGKVKLNIYAQTTEPTDKDGIWFQTDKTFDKIYFDEYVKRISVEGLDTINKYPTFGDSWIGTSALVDNYIYVFCCTTVYKYNILTNEIEDTLTISQDFRYFSSACTVGTDIYILSSHSSYSTLFKFDTVDNSLIRTVNTNHSLNGNIIAIGTDIYLFGGQNAGAVISKYDTTTGVLTSNIATSPIYVQNTSTILVNMGKIIYMIGGNKTSTERYTYKFDTETKEFTKLTNFPSSSSRAGIGCIIDNYIYIFGKGSSLKSVYKYNILDNTYIALNDLSLEIGFSNTCYGRAFLVDNKVFIMPQSTENIMYVYALTYDSVYSYENNSVVVWDGFGAYKTQLTKSAENQEGKIQTLFYNAYHYTIENGLDDTIPTYYGDGTQWIKFKN